ncbi:MAG: hypothetical protein R3288_10855 [Woeseiaceae bacterium]|nr:hypothetical protein [Woeseiaceae bacterium]
MALNRARESQSPDTVVLEMAQHLEVLARDGEWDAVENLTVRLRSAVMNVPEDRRREAIHEVQRVTDKVLAEAEIAHRDLADRLSGLRRGQVATRAYQSG